MSYTIEYNRQFIKTKNGYIPCWLSGDNNVTTGWGKNERRVRDWSIFMGWLDVSEDYMLEHIKEFYNDFNQHWKRGSEFVTNEGLLRWIKNGCKAAGTVEDILEVNPFLKNIKCYVVFYDVSNGRSEILNSTITTSKGLEEWLKNIKDFKNSPVYKDCKGFYPVVDFVIEDLKHPVKKSENIMNDTDKFLLKHKNMYLVSISKNNSNWTKNLREASVYSYADYLKLKEEYMGTYLGGILTQVRLVKAEKKEQVLYIIKFIDGVYAGRYLGKKHNGRVSITFYARDAKQYSSKKFAENALNSYKYDFSKYGNLEIEELS